ncbi:LOW QUALITY PROTEIN: CDGSH iron-sulfur domain-containing protein 3, mitochondrial-like [Melanerpes formicivorus]|uniref:LOW QUALITY PROTEIN: CDGSH iron-sulfur domain-containing protein 3, mitochondrial-like n=1 Tax=Melanerpes formicivorus TaxID=211600 RepID=UPI00358E91EB
MAWLRPAALGTLMRTATGAGRLEEAGRLCGHRYRHTPPELWDIPSLLSALPVRRYSVPPQPVIAAKEPFAVELKAGKKYAWCSCGHSEKQPFCDGAHKKAAPGASPLRFTAEEDGTAWLCGCKRTRTPPYCDGTHKEEAVQAAQPPTKP